MKPALVRLILLLVCAWVTPACAAPLDSTRATTPAIEQGAASDTLANDLLRADAGAAVVIPQPTVAPPETTAVAVRSVPVFLGGQQIFLVRVSRDGLDPRERAKAIRTRLTQAVTDARVSADSVRLIAQSDGIQVRLGPYFLWLITPGDAPSHDSAELATALAGLPRLIGEGVRRERAQRRPARLLVAAAFALLLTVVAFALLRLMLIGSRQWQGWLSRSLGHRFPAIRVRSFEILSKAQVGALVTGALTRLDVVVAVLLAYAYLTMVFSLFPWTQGWSSMLLTLAATQALQVIGAMAAGLPGLFAIALIILVFRWLNGLANRFFNAIADGTMVLGQFHPELAAPSRKLVSIMLWLVAIVLAYPYVPGSGTRAVQGVSLLFGLVVSLGSTGIIGNMIAGFVLTYSRSFNVGDRVRIGEHVGDVVVLGFFATKLRSLRNEEITIPNGQVAGTSILNYTRLAKGPGLILHTQVTIGYDADWRQVHALLIEAAKRVSGVEATPEPWVLQRSLNDYYPTYELCCVTRDSHAQLQLYSDLHAEIQDAFSRAGVEILSPAYHALRDANRQVLPREPAGPRATPEGFRVERGS